MVLINKRRELLLDGIKPLFPYKRPMTKEGISKNTNTFMMSITIAISAQRTRYYPIEQQTGLATVNTKVKVPTAVIVHKDLSVQKAKSI